jgi:Prolyl oligopeptidase family
MNRRRACLAVLILLLTTSLVSADGPADNIPASVRRIPKEGVKLALEVRDELTGKLADLRKTIDKVAASSTPRTRDFVLDLEVLYKAVHDALAYDEFFDTNEIAKARKLLSLGQQIASAADVTGEPRGLLPGKKLTVGGYRSKIDGSVQPYGLVIPEGPVPTLGYRLDVWCHGRGETLSELNFIDERLTRIGEFNPPGTIVLHPYGRYCNANKFAGEIDVLEAIDAVKSRYKIDPDRVAIRGFSMGGASAWQFAVHYPDMWFAANPGAGFSETPRFLNVFQRETLQPTWYEKKLWHLYDCTDVAANIWECPTVAYSGELDNQKQAADVMAEALEKVGLELTHVIGPKTKHAYHPAAKVEVERKMADLAATGPRRFPTEIRFATYTLRYNQSNWLAIDALSEHWKKGSVKADVFTGERQAVIVLEADNVEALTVAFPAGFVPFGRNPSLTPLVNILNPDKKALTEITPAPQSDRSFSLSVHLEDRKWVQGRLPSNVLRKKHGLQGPIDDAFMDSFVIVRPTGKSPNEKLASWSEQESKHAIEHWRRHFRGEARVKDDANISDRDIASSNLVLFGDPKSNAILAKIAAKLPIQWSDTEIKVGDQTFDAAHHGVVLIYPNPLNPERYVVLNSGFTFREYDYLNNARQVPKLPDWAIVDLRTPPDARSPGKIVAADFFGETWELKPGGPRD